MTDGPLLGHTIELDVGAPAHGGSCVARHEGRVVFVRHALPGERVRAQVTEDRGGSFVRADAVEILVAAPDRVVPPCPHSGPRRCGGCDWQHASAEAQRRMKLEVVRDLLLRLGGIDVTDLLSEVEALPGGLLGWRTQITYAVDADGRPGLHRYRSHDVEAVDTCPLGVPGVGDSEALSREWPGLTGIQAVRGADGAVTLLAHRPGPGRQARGRRPPDRVEVVSGPAQVSHDVSGRRLAASASGFWQVHPHAVSSFTAALLDLLAPHAGETVLDLYAGAGALTSALADAVGQSGRVIAIESNQKAVADAAANLADRPWAEIRRQRIDPGAVAGLAVRPDLIVLDPPRAGAGPAVMTAILGLGARAVGYVACDPAALARDVRAALESGWTLGAVRAFDAFPMTHHVECVALLVPGSAVGAGVGAALTAGLAAGESATPSATDTQRRDGDTPSPYDSVL